MSNEDESPAPRAGTAADLSRRMDRLEQNHTNLATTVGSLTVTVERVELNQKHAEELNKLRFDSLDNAIKNIDGTLGRFMARINAIVTGEVKLPQAVQGEQMVADYLAWRKETDVRLDKHDAFEVQGRLLARLAVILVTSNVFAIVVAIVAAVNAASKTT